MHSLTKPARSRRRIAAAAIGTGLLAAACSASAASSPTTVTDATPAAASSPAPVEPGARLVDVVDGDTIHVDVNGARQTVRLIGINTPEVGECLHDQAAAALAELVDDGNLVLIRDTSDTDQYGRLLRFVEVDGADVGAAMIGAGYAIARDYPPDTARSATYNEMQSAAQADHAGRWAPTACGPASAAPVSIDVRPDADGDDSQNMNGEWVSFTNTGTSDLNLEGWTIADESSSNRYTFGTVTLQAGATITVASGCGDDTEDLVHWCAGRSAVWNNDGDTVYLHDPAGNVAAAVGY